MSYQLTHRMPRAGTALHRMMNQRVQPGVAVVYTAYMTVAPLVLA